MGIFDTGVQIGVVALRTREIPRLRLAPPLRGGKKKRESPLGVTVRDGLNRRPSRLLQALRSGIVTEQILENSEDVLAVLDDAFQN